MNFSKLVIVAQFFFLVSIAGSELAYSFPENVRLGYARCSTCHVSPTGGGALTKYGRQASEEFMGTWSTKGEND